MKIIIKHLIAIGVVLLFSIVPAVASDGEIEICGFIESIDSSQVTLNGVSYPLDEFTEYEDENDNSITVEDFVVGELIELEILNGKVKELEKEDDTYCGDNSSDEEEDEEDDDENEDDDEEDNDSSKKKKEKLCGKIAELTSSTITVGNSTYDITSETEFESNSGEDLTLSAFSVGDFVELAIKNGVLHEVEFETSSSCRSKKAKKANRKSDANKSTFKRNRYRTKLLPPTGLTTSAKGFARYMSKAKRGRSKNRFRVKVKIPVPSSIPVLSNEGDAASLQLSVFIKRGTDTLATCLLEFDEVDSGVAEYKIALRERGPKFRAKKGTCDIDLALPGAQNGIPSFNKGDSISIILPDLSTLLEGSL